MYDKVFNVDCVVDIRRSTHGDFVKVYYELSCKHIKNNGLTFDTHTQRPVHTSQILLNTSTLVLYCTCVFPFHIFQERPPV